MQGFEVKFNVYANTQEEADLASASIKQFISGLAEQGVAITAERIARAANKWKNNYFVINYFK